MGAGMGAGIFAGGLLDGIGKGFAERRARQEKLKLLATEAGLKQLTGMMEDPTFSGDPQARQDILQSYFSILGEVSGKKGKSGKNDPVGHMQEQIGEILNKVYPSGQAQPGQPGAAPVSVRGQEIAPGMTGKAPTAERRGPFRSPFEIKNQLEEDEQRKADIKERAASQQIELKERMINARKDAERKARMQNFNLLTQPFKTDDGREITGMSPEVAWAWTHDDKTETNPYKNTSGSKAATAVVIELNDGTKVEGWEDRYNRDFTDLKGGKIDPTKIKGVNPKSAASGDKGMLGELEAAQAKLADPKTSPTDRAAAKLFIDNYSAGLQSKLNNNGAGGGGALSDQELRNLASMSLITHQDPAFGMGKSGVRDRYNKIKAQLIGENPDGAGGAAATQAEYKATTGALTDLTKVRAQMRSAENGTVAEINRLQELSKRVSRSDIRAFNTFDQFLKAQLTPATDLARFREALLAARYRYNSMITSLRAGGASTNQVRSETAEEIINRNMANGTIQAAAEEMKVGVRNVMKGVDKAVEDTRKSLASVGKPKEEAKDDPKTSLPKAAKPGTLASADIMKQYMEAYGSKDEAIKALKAAGYR